VEIPSLELIYVLLILLPGFVTLGIESVLVYQTNKSNFDKIVKSLIYAAINFFIVYLILYAQGRPFLPFILEKIDDQKSRVGLAPDLPSMLWLFGMSILLGFIISLLRTHDWHMEIARKLKMTKRTSRQSIWLDIFHEKYKLNKKKKTEKDYGAWIYVYLKNGKVVYGWPEHFADNYEDGPVIFLTEAYWISDDADRPHERISNPGILINSSEIQYMTFYVSEDEKMDQQDSKKPLKESKNPPPEKKTPPVTLPKKEQKNE